MLKPCLAVILGLTLMATAHAQVYQWRDAKGKVHFGDQPPPGVAAKLVRPGLQGAPTETPAPAPEPASTPEPAPEPEIDLSIPDDAGELPLETDTTELEPLDADIAPEEPALLAPAPTPAAAAPAAAPAQPELTTQQKIEAELKASQDERNKAREAQAQAERERQRTEALAQDCARARNQLTALEGGQRFARINERGEREVLDEKARAAEVARMREMIGTNCK